MSNFGRPLLLGVTKGLIKEKLLIALEGYHIFDTEIYKIIFLLHNNQFLEVDTKNTSELAIFAKVPDILLSNIAYIIPFGRYRIHLPIRSNYKYFFNRYLPFKELERLFIN